MAGLQVWLELRKKFQRSESLDQPLFLTTTGSPDKVGKHVSADSLRKVVTAAFAGNTATHSLRKGGARFYSAAQAPEQATMVQGGWRTTDTMRTIYTTLTKAEVHQAIHTAAKRGGAEVAIEQYARELGGLQGSPETLGDDVLANFLKTVSLAVGIVPWSCFTKNKVGVIVKRLTSHNNNEIRRKAIQRNPRRCSEVNNPLALFGAP